MNVLADKIGVRRGRKTRCLMKLRLTGRAAESITHTPTPPNFLPIATKTLSVFGGSPKKTRLEAETCAVLADAKRSESGGLGNSQITFPVSKNGRSTRSFRYELREKLRRITSIESVKRCGAVAIGQRVNLVFDGSRAGYAALHTCSSVWACPVCSAKISAKRKVEVERVISAATRQNKFVSMLTLTQRHHQGQKLADLWDGLSYAWSKVTSGRRWQEFKNQLGLTGFIRAVEVTHGEKGWHVHTHVLIISEKDPTVTPVFWQRKQGRRKTPYPAEIYMPADFIAQRWANALATRGIDFIKDKGGLDWQTAKPGDEKTLGQYVAKLGVKAVNPIDGISKEVTLGGFKKARKGNRTPFQILEDVFAYGLEEDRKLWIIWEKVSRGRRALNWSQGLRDWAGLGAEKTDEELAAEETSSTTVALFKNEDWKKLRRVGSGDLLDVMEQNGLEAGYQWLKEHRICYEIPPKLEKEIFNLNGNGLLPPF